MASHVSSKLTIIKYSEERDWWEMEAAKNMRSASQQKCKIPRPLHIARLCVGLQSSSQPSCAKVVYFKHNRQQGRGRNTERAGMTVAGMQASSDAPPDCVAQ